MKINANIRFKKKKKVIAMNVFLQLSPYGASTDLSTTPFSKTFLCVCACVYVWCVCILTFPLGCKEKKEKWLICHMFKSFSMYVNFYIVHMSVSSLLSKLFWKRFIFDCEDVPHACTFRVNHKCLQRWNFKVGHTITKNLVDMGSLCLKLVSMKDTVTI